VAVLTAAGAARARGAGEGGASRRAGLQPRLQVALLVILRVYKLVVLERDRERERERERQRERETERERQASLRRFHTYSERLCFLLIDGFLWYHVTTAM